MGTRRKSSNQRAECSRQLMQDTRIASDSHVSTSVAQANFHQSHQRFGTAAGKQCTCNVLHFLLASTDSSVSSWTTSDMNHSLDQGSDLYTHLHAANPSISYFMISELPEYIEIANSIYHIQYGNPMGGVISNDISSPDAAHYSLLDALHCSSTQQQTTFVTFGSHSPSYTVGFLNQDRKYFIFDSHSRTPLGMFSDRGCAVLLSFGSIRDVHDHLKEVASSLHIQNDEFEVTPAKITDMSNSPASAMQCYFADQALQQQHKNMMLFQAITTRNSSTKKHKQLKSKDKSRKDLKRSIPEFQRKEKSRDKARKVQERTGVETARMRTRGQNKNTQKN
ncbi:uncharacterized protein [Amphiura filiformis]|uniref:uncharacterized protein n=1 Tax=Amphiura filiformis TaxID=82378 RepID=UPI003B2217DA